jgi:hypothetical protein
MRRVFFSFHFKRDSFLVGQVRNSWLGNAAFAGQPYLDKAQWESIERQGDRAVQNWIDSQMKGTSVTVVLIGSETLQRRWVKYEIDKTLERGAGLIGVSLTGMTNIDRVVEYKSCSIAGTPFETKKYGSSYPVYNWSSDNGRQNLGMWIQQAAVRAGR